MISNGTINATLDRGTLDAIYITWETSLCRWWIGICRWDGGEATIDLGANLYAFRRIRRIYERSIFGRPIE